MIGKAEAESAFHEPPAHELPDLQKNRGDHGETLISKGEGSVKEDEEEEGLESGTKVSPQSGKGCVVSVGARLVCGQVGVAHAALAPTSGQHSG